MTVSERLRSCWGPSQLAYHSDLRSSLWSKPQFIYEIPPWAVCFLITMRKKTACVYELQLLQISRSIFLSDSILETWKTSGKSVKFNLPRRSISVLQTIANCELWRFVSFDSLTFLTVVVLFNQLDYLNQFIKDSDWLIVMCFTRARWLHCCSLWK